MVLRTSNGAPFIVLAPPPQLRTGIRVEVYDRDNPGTLLAVLSETRAREWLEELNAPGSGSFEIHDLDGKLEADPTLLTYGNLVRFYLDGVLRAGFRIEAIDRIQAAANDDADRWLKVSGRGPLGILEDAVVYPSGGVGGAPDPRPYVNATSGLIIRELIAEAQARGTALVGVTTDFTDTDDTFNAPFLTELTLDEDVGGDLLRVAGRHTAMAADVWMTPQLVLRYANTRGIDRSTQLPSSGPTVLRLGRSISELSNTEVGRITNTVLIQTPAGFLERVDLASLGLFNRREGFLSLGNVSDGATIDKTTAALFAELADPRASSTLELIAAPGATPYADFEVGDWVLSADVNGDLTKQRVRALSVTETEDGRVRYVPELATIEEELESSLERWLASSAKGTLGGAASKIAEPNQLDTQGTTSVVDSGIADHLAGQPHHDELGDLTDVDVTGGAALDDHLIFDGVDWIPSPFAGGGGGGPSPFLIDTDVLTRVGVDIDTYTAGQTKTILDIVSGGVELVGGAIYHAVAQVKITVDGTIVLDTITPDVTFRGDDTGGDSFGSIPLPAIRADTSLKIEVRNDSGISRNIGFLLWHRPLGGGPTAPAALELLQTVGDNSVRALTASATWEDVAGTSITFTPNALGIHIYKIHLHWHAASADWLHHNARVHLDGATTGVTPSVINVTQRDASDNGANFTTFLEFEVDVTSLAAGQVLKLQSEDGSSGLDRTFDVTRAYLWGPA